MWINKLNQVKEELKENEFVSEHLNLMIEELNLMKLTNAEFELNEILIENALFLLEYFPTNDFKEIFFILDNYKGRDHLTFNRINRKNDSEYLEIKESLLNAMIKPVTNRSSMPDEKDCNCKWTCGLNELLGGTVTDDCGETVRGCGLLWLQSCKKRVSIF